MQPASVAPISRAAPGHSGQINARLGMIVEPDFGIGPQMGGHVQYVSDSHRHSLPRGTAARIRWWKSDTLLRRINSLMRRGNRKRRWLHGGLGSVQPAFSLTAGRWTAVHYAGNCARIDSGGPCPQGRVKPSQGRNRPAYVKLGERPAGPVNGTDTLPLSHKGRTIATKQGPDRKDRGAERKGPALSFAEDRGGRRMTVRPLTLRRLPRSGPWRPRPFPWRPAFQPAPPLRRVRRS